MKERDSMQDTFQLRMIKGHNPGEIFRLSKDQITLGRDLDCNLVLVSSEVSRKHLLIGWDNEQHWIQDQHILEVTAFAIVSTYARSPDLLQTKNEERGLPTWLCIVK